MIRVFATMIAVVVACVFSTSASAVAEFRFDLNSLSISTAGGSAFGGAYIQGGLIGVGHTGSLTIAGDANTILAGVLIDGTAVPFSYTSVAVTGSISLVGGAVVGGAFTVTIDGTDSYSASISGGGFVNTQAGQGFTIDGLTFNGMFSSTTWAAVDVTPWDSAEPLSGSFLNFAYNPNASGVDVDSDMEVFVVIPMPAAAGLASLGLAGLATRRRRTL